MIYTVKTDLPDEIDFAPENEANEVLQNVRTILVTPRGSVPLDREFGISTGYIGKPVTAAKPALIAEVIEAVERYEPRANVESINLAENSESEVILGKLTLEVEVSV